MLDFRAIPNKFYIDEKILPQEWLSLRPDGRLCRIPIAEGLMEYYRLFRPSPLVRAYSLEEKLQTPARIFYKYEGALPGASAGIDSAAAQAFFAGEEGKRGLTAFSSDGRWGVSVAAACAHFGLECRIILPEEAAEERKEIIEWMRAFGAEICFGDGETCLSFKEEGFRPAKDEAVHHTLSGLEAKKVLDELGLLPDILIGDPGLPAEAGLMLPFMKCLTHPPKFFRPETRDDSPEAAVLFARVEGLMTVRERVPVLKKVIEEALKAREENAERTILFGIPEAGFFDMRTYERYNQYLQERQKEA